jgi:hypothetical protein
VEQKVEVREGEESRVEMRLSVGRIAEEVLILSTTITDGAGYRGPGSVETIDRRTLEQKPCLYRQRGTACKVSGVNTRDGRGSGAATERLGCAGSIR